MKKKGKIAILSIIGVFILINVIWFIFVKIQYGSYEKIVPLHTEFKVRHVDNSEKNTLYGYNSPGYLTWTGNLYYTQKFPNEKEAYTIIIWPKLFKEEKYGVIVQEQGESHQIEITPTLDLRGPDLNNSYSEEILEKHRERLEIVLDDARKTFKLND